MRFAILQSKKHEGVNLSFRLSHFLRAIFSVETDIRAVSEATGVESISEYECRAALEISFQLGALIVSSSFTND